ncbi:MAG: amino acid permease, partial [Candidatus Eremiobacteraeota bacterium]|nr:amino acid permease [Candidatus Eremiobacteraeota bacterium]
MMQRARLVRRLGTVDIALIVIGSVIGSGIFRTPAVVAHRVPDAVLILVAWTAGGVIALFGAFVLAELAARNPDDCGMYGYFRDAFHPIVAFAYGWSALLAILSGGLAAGAVLFAGYFLSLTGLRLLPAVVAAITLAVLALLNALGVRQGANAQHVLTVLKVGALFSLVIVGLVAPPATAY